MLPIHDPCYLKECCFLQEAVKQARPKAISVKYNSMQNTHGVSIFTPCASGSNVFRGLKKCTAHALQTVFINPTAKANSIHTWLLWLHGTWNCTYTVSSNGGNATQVITGHWGQPVFLLHQLKLPLSYLLKKKKSSGCLSGSLYPLYKLMRSVNKQNINIFILLAPLLSI